MISFEEALRIILSHSNFPVHDLELAEEADLINLVGRVLAQPVISTINIPIFDNSAMDGYGVRSCDVTTASPENPIQLPVQATVKAGDFPKEKLLPNHAVRIYTGAPIPQGVDAVCMKEDCDNHESTVIIKKTPQPNDHIRHKGEEFQVGQTVLSAGMLITPPIVGLLATLGHAKVMVYKQPIVHVLTTGTELCEPGNTLAEGHIYDSNSYALEAAVKSLRYPYRITRRVPDDLDTLTNTLKQALQSTDCLITVGGISVGEFDLVKEALQRLGATIHFWKISIKPGKPVLFATLEDKLIFALPGNPVSALLTFQTLVKPALKKRSGLLESSELVLTAKLAEKLTKKQGRLEWCRSTLSPSKEGLIACLTKGQDSHMLGGLAKANGLVCFPKDSIELNIGDPVEVSLLQWT